MSDDMKSLDDAARLLRDNENRNAPPRRRRGPVTCITKEMGELYVRATEIRRRSLHEKWEYDGGRRREYHEVTSALHRALGRRPWHVSPLDVSLCDLSSIVDDRDARDMRGAIAARRILDRYLPRVARVI